RTRKITVETTAMASKCQVIDSHLHVWASPEEAASRHPYFPGQEPSMIGSKDFLLQCMDDAGVDGALIVQPINHMFDHSYINSVLQRYPTKFVGCCLANPAEDGSGIGELEHLVTKEGYRAVRFNPYLWPDSQKMTNKVGKTMFAKSGELGVPVGFMCFKVYVKLSASFRVSRKLYPYDDTSSLLSDLVTTFGAKRLMWGSDFPFVVKECGYKEARDQIPYLSSKGLPLSNEDLEWIMGKTAMHLFP
ncbi:hypothetical protein KI387_014016, partial [Taxus chinensis]